MKSLVTWCSGKFMSMKVKGLVVNYNPPNMDVAAKQLFNKAAQKIYTSMRLWISELRLKTLDFSVVALLRWLQCQKTEFWCGFAHGHFLMKPDCGRFNYSDGVWAKVSSDVILSYLLFERRVRWCCFASGWFRAWKTAAPLTKTSNGILCTVHWHHKNVLR